MNTVLGILRNSVLVDKKETIDITLQTVDELHNTTGRAHILISIDVNSHL